MMEQDGSPDRMLRDTNAIERWTEWLIERESHQEVGVPRVL